MDRVAPKDFVLDLWSEENMIELTVFFVVYTLAAVFFISLTYRNGYALWPTSLLYGVLWAPTIIYGGLYHWRNRTVWKPKYLVLR